MSEYMVNLIEHVEVAESYIAELCSKRFKTLKDRRAIKHWASYKAGIERAIFLAEIYLEEVTE